MSKQDDESEAALPLPAASCGRFDLKALSAAFVLSAVAGCSSASREVVPDPTGITLENAMVSVVRSLRLAEREARSTGTEALGLNTCTVTATFNITADGRDRGQLVVDAKVAPQVQVAPASLGAQATRERATAATRGNQVTILLTSPACNPPDTLGTTRPGAIGAHAAAAKRVRQDRLTQGGSSIGGSISGDPSSGLSRP